MVKSAAMKRFTKTEWGFDIRCFGGFLVIYSRDVFCVWWSTDSTPPIKDMTCGGKYPNDRGFWIIGNYGKWARSDFA